MEAIRSLPFGLAVAALFVIVWIRANATYWLGRGVLRGRVRGHRLRDRLAGPRMDRAERLTARYGVVAVPLSFLTIGIQTAINFTAGATAMPLRRYLPAVTVGCVLWALLYATLGTVGISAVWGLLNHT